jgi:hypothetical protein
MGLRPTKGDEEPGGGRNEFEVFASLAGLVKSMTCVGSSGERFPVI